MTRIMIDTIGATARNIPVRADVVAGYITGSPDIIWSTSDWTMHLGQHITIDQSNGPAVITADVYDVEAGAKTLAQAIAGARDRKSAGFPHSVIYISAASLTAARAAVAAAGLTGHVYWLVANWALDQAEASALIRGDIIGIQFASPTTNPDTILPGTNHTTLREANCDLSVIADWWKPSLEQAQPAVESKPVHPKVKATAAAGVLATALLAGAHTAGLHVTTLETAALTAVASVIAGYLKSA